MELLQPIVGAVIAWTVPKLLESVLRRSRQEEDAPRELQRSFPWVKWCFALAVGGGVGGFLSGVLGVLGVQTPGGLGNWTAFGVAIGVSQWIVLSRYMPIAPFWAVCSALGWSVWAFFQAGKLNPYLGWASVGLVAGLLQWPILARHLRKSVWWVPANIVAWLIAGPIGWVVGLALIQARTSLPVAWVIGWAVVGAVGSVVLGLALKRMAIKARVRT